MTQEREALAHIKGAVLVQTEYILFTVNFYMGDIERFYPRLLSRQPGKRTSHVENASFEDAICSYPLHDDMLFFGLS